MEFEDPRNYSFVQEPRHHNSLLYALPFGNDSGAVHSGPPFVNMTHNGSTMDDFTSHQFLRQLEFPKRSQAVLIALYSVTGLLSIVGNIVAIIVLTLGNRTKKDLNRYLLNMAIADLAMATFCIPFTFTQVMLGRWVFGWVMCPVVNCMQVTSVAVSIYTNVAIGIDRYLVVAKPLRQRVTRTNTRIVICAIWLFSIALGSSQLFIVKAKRHMFVTTQFWECGEIWSTYRARNAYNVCMFALTYLVPLLVLALVYYRVGTALWRQETPGNADVTRDQHRINSKRRVTKMLVVLVIAFAVCWLPLHLFILIIDFAPSVLNGVGKTTRSEMLFLGLYYASHWFAMVGCLANPVIYCFLNESFRRRLTSGICCVTTRVETASQFPWQRASHDPHVDNDEDLVEKARPCLYSPGLGCGGQHALLPPSRVQLPLGTHCRGTPWREPATV